MRLSPTIAAMGLGSLLWAGAALAQDKAASHLAICDDANRFCAGAQTEFKADYPKAWRGNYQAQRNVAFMFGRDPDGAVRKNPLLACAWRMVIVNAGHLELGTTDTSNVKIDCGKLDEVEQAAATRQAITIQQTIRRRR